MDEQKGQIFNIQKFCTGDGPGIRTTVFLKGCPLDCLWCHNPESKETRPEISYNQERCIGCGRCVSSCARHCHEMKDGMHIYHREDCIRCGKCGQNFCNALEAIGREVTVREVMDEVLKDKIFYANSNGGITLSGGEPMMQPAFTLALLSEAKANGLHTCLETCGFAPRDNFDEILDLVDIFLYDYKETDPALHKEFTGVDNDLIIENLFHIDRLGGRVILRVPIVPGCNDRADHFEGIAKTANRLKNILEINIEPYHTLGKSKCENVGKRYPLNDTTFPSDEAVEEWMHAIASQTNVTVKKG